MIRRPPRSTLSSSSAASDVYKRQVFGYSPTRSRSGSSRSASRTQKTHGADPPPPPAWRIYSIRHGEKIRSTGGALPVDHFPQFLADLEEGDPLLGDGDLLARLRV